MIPRPEHPRPQFERANWINLNGQWTFTFDFGRSGADKGRELYLSKGFDKEITVPFCPESPLSGVGYYDFIEGMWYHRKLLLPPDWEGKRIILHFGGVDYESEAYLNGESVGKHFGGACSFAYDITEKAKFGEEMDLVLRVEDVMREDLKGSDFGNVGCTHPYGKQCFVYQSHGCSYTRTTGIWQTVWVEALGKAGLADCFMRPDIDAKKLYLTPSFYEVPEGLKFRCRVFSEGKVVTEGEWEAKEGKQYEVSFNEMRLWSPSDPYLYDVEFETVLDGAVVDFVKSYTGLRKYHCANGKIYLNNEPIFMRMVLDQGFYPDGIWTAPSDAALKQDIVMSMAAGFNGARLHQKVFEERFHYWADKLGYLTWGEFPSWGCDPNMAEACENHKREWKEVLLRDRNHPSIVAWTPWNETWGIQNRLQHENSHMESYRLCTQLDPSRPVNTASGGVHYATDIWTVHMYHKPDKLPELLVADENGHYFENFPEQQETKWHGQPYVVDEIGGIGYIPPDRKAFASNTWGYGGMPQTEEEFLTRLKETVKCFVEAPHVQGFCYTQLTDVEQEQNGVYNYDRTNKVPVEKLHEIFTQERPDFK